VTKWGTEGSFNAQFGYPQGVAVAPDGSVYVAEALNYCIKKPIRCGTFREQENFRNRFK